MRTIRLLLLLSPFAAGPAYADSLLALSPMDGVVSGAPGQTVGWGFDLTADSTNWTSITGSFILFDSNPGLGLYSDFIGPQGGPSGGVLPPAAPDWMESFDAGAATGLGSYAISSLASAGQSDSGAFLVEYETFSDNPATCGSCFVSSGTFVENFTVNVAPEPSSFSFAAAAILAALAARRAKAWPDKGSERK